MRETAAPKRPIDLHAHKSVPPQKKTIDRQGLGDLAKTAINNQNMTTIKQTN
jgi:hypothetical protein